MFGKEASKNGPMYFGEFKDKRLEREFTNYDIGNALKYLKPVLLALGVLYLSFSIADYFLIKNDKVLGIILTNRIIMFVLIVLLSFCAKRFKDYTFLTYWLTGYELLVSLSFLINLSLYESPSFLAQSLGLILIILVVFMVPNKWKNMIFASVLISVSFSVFSFYYFEEIKFREFSAGIVHILLVVILCSLASYQMSYYKRIQYINEKQLIQLSNTDALTGIHNRLKFNEELTRWINISKRYNTALSIAIFDIDDFKRINDKYGHLVGDKVIIEIVKTVANALRNIDIFARWGGDEFVILFPNTDGGQVSIIIERIKMLISEHKIEEVGNVSCSFGASSLKPHEDMEAFLNEADKMLYKAKEERKNSRIRP